MALYDWPINQYNVPNNGLLYDNVNPYADSVGLMNGAYTPWDTPAVDSNYTGNPWVKGPDVTWGSPNTDHAAYMQKLADDEAEAIRNANNINNNNPYYYGSDGEGAGVPAGPNTGPIADYVDAVIGNMANNAYGIQGFLGNLQGMTAAEIEGERAQAEAAMSGDPSAEAEAAAAAGGATMGGMDQ